MDFKIILYCYIVCLTIEGRVYILKDIYKIVQNRFLLMAFIALIMFMLLAYRFYDLQIVQGAQYQEAYVEQIERTEIFPGIRGNIYDRNGELLAYNILTYDVSIEDNGIYDSQAERNRELNHVLRTVLELLAETGDRLTEHLPIQVNEDGDYSYTIEGNGRLRFLADVYGHSDTDALTYNETLGYDEAAALPEQVLAYLCSENMYSIDNGFPADMAYGIAAIRYSMSQNRYQRYRNTYIAQDISEESMAAIYENLQELPGVEITQGTRRHYNDSIYLAHIMGYTGAVSETQLEKLNAEGGNYLLTDQVGIAGIEQVMEQELRGLRGEEHFYADSLGRKTLSLSRTEAESGKDVYLTVDVRLQKVIYELLEQELAGILLSNMENTSNREDMKITEKDVYHALIDNNVIKLDSLGGSDTGQLIEALFQENMDEILMAWNTGMGSSYSMLPDEMQEYQTYALSWLGQEGIYLTDKVNRNSGEYAEWREGNSSLEEYLLYLITQGYMNVPALGLDEEYLSVNQVYTGIVEYMTENLPEDKEFQKSVYRNLVNRERLTGAWLCMVLMEQEVLPMEEEIYSGLEQGRIEAFSYLKEKIRSLEITPAQLALDPSTASSVVLDAKTGEVLACVTYPGYDNNRLANRVDGEYYNSLLQDRSRPLYNNATQQQTAPGSTFKPVMAAAALTEGIITPETKVRDMGIFTEITPSPSCWIYPNGTHESINVSEAIRDSCNYFFYQIGFWMSTKSGRFRDADGIDTINQYARYFGLGENTGIEIEETMPLIADEYPVTAAIGQSNHNYTTVQLARYTAALASKGNLYSLSLIKGTADAGEGIPQMLQPHVERRLDKIDSVTWDAVSRGMQMVGDNNSYLDTLGIQVAGKTGTAQQTVTRPNHALFIGYAPYANPEIAIATRIAHGYSSVNAVEVSANILKYYFGLENEETLVTGQARDAAGSRNVVMD